MRFISFLLYSFLIGAVFSIFVMLTMKYKMNRCARSLTGSHEKIITVYEKWEDTKIKVQMTEWTWELVTKDEWANLAYHSWVSVRLFDAFEDPLARQETYWFGEVPGFKLDH